MDDIDFYERQVKFQENLAKIQQRRSVLEQEFFNLTKTDKKLRSIRTTKLRNYWKKICERERKAHERNATLLRDVEEFEERLSKVAADTAKLEKIKNECENELTKIYPQWRYEIDLSKARRQVEESGVKLDSQLAPPSLSSILHAPQGSPVIQAPLFKLIPYNFEQEKAFPKMDLSTLQTTPKDTTRNFVRSQNDQAGTSKVKQGDSRKREKKDVVSSQESFESPNRTASLTKSQNFDKNSQRGFRPETSKVSMQSQDLPMLKDPDNVSTSSLDTASSSPFVPPLELKSIDKKEELVQSQKTASGHAIESMANSYPEPVLSLHRSADVNNVHQVAVKTKPKDSKNEFLSDLSDVSSVSDESSANSPPENNALLDDGEMALPEKKSSIILTDKVSASSESPAVVISPKVSEPIKIPGLSVETLDSLPSESVTTEPEPSQKGLPLTSNPAYQNMLRSNEFSSTFGMSENFEEGDDADELDKIVSAKSKDLELTLSDEDDDLTEDEKSFNNSKLSEHLSSKKDTPKKPTSFLTSSFTIKKQKAPWETDSEEESSYRIPKAERQTFSADDDDFDFFD